MQHSYLHERNLESKPIEVWTADQRGLWDEDGLNKPGRPLVILSPKWQGLLVMTMSTQPFGASPVRRKVYIRGYRTASYLIADRIAIIATDRLMERIGVLELPDGNWAIDQIYSAQWVRDPQLYVPKTTSDDASAGGCRR